MFTRMKHAAGRLADQLERDGIRATAIHGDKSQIQRLRALAEFKEGKVDILVATDVAARGLDIDALPHVVNYELPTVAQDYVHRIGRTGRAGMDGDAISLVAPEEEPLLEDIQRLLKHEIEIEVIREFLPGPADRREAPAPRMRGFREPRREPAAATSSSRPRRSTPSPVRQSTPSSRPSSRRFRSGADRNARGAPLPLGVVASKRRLPLHTSP